MGHLHTGPPPVPIHQPSALPAATHALNVALHYHQCTQLPDWQWRVHMQMFGNLNALLLVK